MLPNQQDTDQKLSAYAIEGPEDTRQTAALKSFFEKYPCFRNGLLIFVLLGTCMAIGDGIFTPTISGSYIIIKANSALTSACSYIVVLLWLVV